MAFKMKNPSMGKMVKAAGDSRAATKMKSAESPMKMGKKSPMEKDKDFGVEGSAMKFKGIRDKIAARRVSKEKFRMADDPNYKASDKKRISDEVSKGQRNLDNKKQDIAQTGVTKQTKKGKTKEYQVDQDGKVKSLSKVKTRGRKDLVLEDGTIKRRGRKVTKTISADGTKRKVITDSSGKVLKDKTSKRKRKQLDKTVSGRAAELKVKKARKREDYILDKANKPIKDYNAKELAAFNKKKAELEARGLTVDTSEQDDPSPVNSPVDMKKRSGLKMKKRSPMKEDKDGKVVKSITLTKDEKTNTTTTPGSEETKPGGSKNFNDAFSKACKGGAKTFMFNGKSYKCETAPEKKTTPSTTKTTTTPAEKETITLKEKGLNKKIRKEGEFNTEEIKKKKKGAGKKKVKDFIRKTFTRKNKGDGFCPTDGPKLGC